MVLIPRKGFSVPSGVIAIFLLILKRNYRPINSNYEKSNAHSSYGLNIRFLRKI